MPDVVCAVRAGLPGNPAIPAACWVLTLTKHLPSPFRALITLCYNSRGENSRSTVVPSTSASRRAVITRGSCVPSSILESCPCVMPTSLATSCWRNPNAFRRALSPFIGFLLTILSIFQIGIYVNTEYAESVVKIFEAERASDGAPHAPARRSRDHRLHADHLQPL